MKAIHIHEKSKNKFYDLSQYPGLAQHGLSFAISLCFLCLVYHSTLGILVHKYATSGTYAHGFIIYPIVAWMIFSKREYFKQIPLRFEPLGILCLFVLSIGWYVADIALVGIIKQLSFILMIITLFASSFGFKIALKFAFPLAYLLFAIPFGNFLTPSLQNLTAHFAVYALELTGIPVFFEGWQISTSSGDFEVAAACSGIRYLIATLALGILYAYYTYQKPHKRIIFALVCVFVPLIANGLRAYLIIVIAHYSKMKYAVGVDHLIYGWIFFGLIIFLLFSIGSHWRDEPEVLVTSPTKPIEYIPSSKSYICGTFLLLSFSLVPIVNFLMIQADNQSVQLERHWPQGNLVWQGPLVQTRSWGPDFHGPDFEQTRTYVKNGKNVGVFVALYLNQSQGNELISESNKFFDPISWSLLDKRLYAFNHNAFTSVVELDIQSKTSRRLIWYVYMIGGTPTTNPVWGKILEGYAKVTQNKSGSGVLILSTEYDYYADSARKTLEMFLEEMGEPLMSSLFYEEE